jgi:Coenzyme PQQ synthesis protein D (PqqD)
MPRRRRRKERRFRRADGVEAREVGREFFVVAPESRTIHQLDEIASATWRALSESRSTNELIAMFRAAFPKTPKRRIAKDIANLLASLEERHLVVSIDVS